MSHTRQRTTLTPAGDSTSKTSISFVYRQAVARRQRPLLRLHRQPRQQPPQPLHRALLPPLHQGRRPRRDPGRRPGRVPHRGRDPKPPVIGCSRDRWSRSETEAIAIEAWFGYSRYYSISGSISPCHGHSSDLSTGPAGAGFSLRGPGSPIPATTLRASSSAPATPWPCANADNRG
jgi:hypothetical protein